MTCRAAQRCLSKKAVPRESQLGFGSELNVEEESGCESERDTCYNFSTRRLRQKSMCTGFQDQLGNLARAHLERRKDTTLTNSWGQGVGRKRVGWQPIFCTCNPLPPNGLKLCPVTPTPSGHGDLPPLLCLQSPTVINSPLKLKLQAISSPRCTIKPSGTTISVTASVTISLAPPTMPEVELSKMIMVRTPG